MYTGNFNPRAAASALVYVVTRQLGTCLHVFFIRRWIESCEINTEAAPHHEVALAIHRVSKAEPRCDAQVVTVERILRIPKRTPDKILRIDQSIQVHERGGRARWPVQRLGDETAPTLLGFLRMRFRQRFSVPGPGDEMAITVIADPQVQDQLPADAPVVLREQPEVLHAPFERRLIGLEGDRGRFIQHHVLKGLVGDLSRSGVRLSSSRKTDDASKLQGVRSAKQRELLFKRVGGNEAPRFIFTIKTCHPRIRDCRNHAGRREGFGLVGIPHEPVLLDSFRVVSVSSETSRRGPRRPSDHVVRAYTARTAGRELWIQGLQRCLDLERMPARERHGQISAGDRVVDFGVDMIVVILLDSGTNPSAQEIRGSVGLVGQRIVIQEKPRLRER